MTIRKGDSGLRAVSPCGDAQGTTTGYNRHKRAKHKPCVKCRAAHAEYQRKYKEFGPGKNLPGPRRQFTVVPQLDDGWKLDGLCNGAEWWFTGALLQRQPNQTHIQVVYRKHFALCQSCPVLEECGDYAQALAKTPFKPDGVWAGRYYSEGKIRYDSAG